MTIEKQLEEMTKKENSMVQIINRHEEDIQLVYQGELFAERVAYELVKDVYRHHREERENLFYAISTYMGDLGAKNLDDYISKVEYGTHTIVELYGFEGNDEGLNVIDFIRNAYIEIEEWKRER